MKVGVIGLGKLGLPMACVLAESGCDVVGIDQDAMTVAVLQRGECTISEPEVPWFMTKHAARMRFDTDAAALAGCEIVFIIVPTPSGGDGQFTLGNVLAAASQARLHTADETLLVVSSTVMPGQMHELAEAVPGRWCYNPRFVALGSVVRDLRAPDFVLIGADDTSCRIQLSGFYMARMAGVCICGMDFTSAEVAKLALNCYVTMKISFANSLAELCDAIGADPLRVVNALGSDHRIGRAYLSPGTAFGGPCFPRDNAALLSVAEDWGVELPLAEAARDVNDWQTQRIVQECIGVDAQRVAVLGIAYKVGTPVVDESAGWQLMRELETEGFSARCHDPQALEFGAPDIAELIDWADTVAIMTPWPEYRGLDLTGKHLIDPWRLYHEHV